MQQGTATKELKMNVVVTLNINGQDYNILEDDVDEYNYWMQIVRVSDGRVMGQYNAGYRPVRVKGSPTRYTTVMGAINAIVGA
jgi:hypothetical protein